MDFDSYSDRVSKQLDEARKVAEKARSEGFDPRDSPEIPVAEDLADRVEELIGPESIADTIRELDEEHSRETVAIKIAERIANGEFSEGNREELIGQAVRTALGILTEGVAVAAPTEGVSNIEVVNGRLRVSFAGPIRAAGGTGASLAVLIADYVRRKLGIGPFEASSELVERFKEEVKLYDEESGGLQYLPSDDEIEAAISNIPVEIAGDPTEKETLSAYADVQGVSTNRVRGGAVLVVAEGILQKIPKLLKHVENLGMDGWEWLEDFKGRSEGDESEEETEKEPKYLRDIIAGRPVFSYPGRKGGFRLRYGRSRNTGLAAGGVHPATMRVLEDHLAPGTQLKLEKPGKATISNPVDTVEGPLVKLRSGEVVRVSDEGQAETLVDEVEEILSLGDLLLGFGEFVENNHPLLPAGYCEEWWAREVEKAVEDLAYVENYVEPPYRTPSPKRAVDIAVKHGVPLHPAYTYPYHDLEMGEVISLGEWLATGELEVHGGSIRCLTLPYDSEKKELLEALEVPHELGGEDGERKIMIGEHAHALCATLCEVQKGSLEFVTPLDDFDSSMELVNRLAPFEVREKAPTRIGARMGRPEKASPREMSPPVRVLYPVGDYGGPTRSIGMAAKRSTSVIDGIDYEERLDLEEHGIGTVGALAQADPEALYEELGNGSLGNGYSLDEVQSWVEKANGEQFLDLEVSLFSCSDCGRVTTSRVCPNCGNTDVLPSFGEEGVDLERRFNSAMNRLGLDEEPEETVKGVKGLTNKGDIAEPLEKGILRAKHGLSIYKDGTVRGDLTEAPLTHFKPEEVNASVEKLKELGYGEDVNGNPLEEDDQLLELKPQDLLLPLSMADYFVRTAQYVDDLLENFYGLEPFYGAESKEDLVGELVIVLAPHISAGTIGRVIGFSEADIGYAHPYIHAGVRRNCDSDEMGVMLLLQALLDFSKKYLPVGHGSSMDAPLVITHPLNPEEIDDEAHNLDVSKRYTEEFYEATLEEADPGGLSETVEDRLGTENQYQNLHFTRAHNTSDISAGPQQCAYKSLDEMEEKTDSQLSIGEKLLPVDEGDVAEKLLDDHFIPDVKGNIRAFSGQEFRCTNCETKYRRVPLSGKCRCGNDLILTVHKSSVEKYIGIAKRIAEDYGVADYMAQWVDLLEREIDSLLDNGCGEAGNLSGDQLSMGDFL